MAQKLLIEYSVFTPKNTQITEGISGNKNMVVEGVVQRAEEFNHNGRRYPFEILKREVDKYIEGPIKENRALGELDHPDSSVVELKNASHIIKSAYMEGNIVYGTVEILNTPSGKILQSLVESGVTLGISSRGVGSTRSQGDKQIVQDDFQLICWDFVSEPSTPGAFMMKEGRELNRRQLNEIFNKSDRIDRIFNDILEWK